MTSFTAGFYGVAWTVRARYLRGLDRIQDSKYSKIGNKNQK